MANYTKSFNFRNGVQVDDSNFIVNSVGLVGIGTTIPEKHLDVRGNAKIVGDARITGFTSVTNIEVVGVMTVGAGITLDPASGIITATKFVGDASGLTNIVAIATGGFIANVGSLTTTAKVGIGSLTPTSLLDVLGDSKFVGVTTFTGITTSSDTLFANSLSVKTLSVEGISTFIGLVTAKGGAYIDNLQIGISDDNEIDTSSGNLTLDSATGQTIVDDNLNVTGIASAADYKGLNDTAADFPNGFTVTTGTFSTKLNTGVGATVGFGTTAYFPDNAAVVFGDDEDLILSHDGEQSILSEQGTGGFKILTSTFRVRNSGNDKQFIVANTGNVKLYQDGNEKFETISTGASVYNQLNVASLDGGTSGLSSHFGALRYGNEDAGTSPYSTRTSLDLINTDSGNINFYLNSNNLSSTGDFFWHKGFNNSRLMTLTGDTGRLGVGIGNTLPENTLHVLGSAKITAAATFGENVDIAGNLTVTGSLNSNVTGNITGHIISAGLSTFSDGLLVTGVTTSTTVNTDRIGINGSVGSNPVEINSGDNKVFITSAGKLGIGTDDVFGNSLFNTGVSISNVVGVGTTLSTAAVDFAEAGKNLGGTSLANRAYMYPPLVDNSEESALTGMQRGALVFNTETNKLRFYNGTNWLNVNET
tara:strand:+ start:815 stop:2755 length:1941 start_codon:yes stop_codon:yes gene_type:complete